MKRCDQVKQFWAEIYTQPNKAKIVYFDTEEQGKEYLKKVGRPNTPLHNIDIELPF